jgi:hypothetical protein
MRKEAAVAYYVVLPWDSPRGSKEKPCKLSSELPNTTQSSTDGDVSSKAWCTKYNTLIKSHKKNAKMSLYMTRRHTGVGEIQLHSLLNSALHKGEWSASRCGRFITGERVGGTH